MTNGETIFLVAFTLLPILGLFGVIIFGLVRQSKETYSILYTSRTFKTSAFEYYFSADTFYAASLAIMGGLIFSASIGMKISPSTVPDWCTYVLVYAITLMMLSIAIYILSLSINYWKYSKNVIIAFDPETRSIRINTDFQEYVIHEGDIENVKIFTNDSYKLFFAYYRLKLTNGEEFVLTSKTKGVFGVFEFFKKIPRVIQKKWFPVIK